MHIKLALVTFTLFFTACEAQDNSARKVDASSQAYLLEIIDASNTGPRKSKKAQKSWTATLQKPH